MEIRLLTSYKKMTMPMLLQVAIAGIVGLFGLLLGICLYTFDPYDPSFLCSTSDINAANNAFGFWGSAIASYIFFFVGGAGYIMVPLCLTIAYKIIYQQLKDFQIWFGYVLAIGALAGLAYYYYLDGIFPFIPGGYVGKQLYTCLSWVLDDFLLGIFLVLLLAIATLLLGDQYCLLAGQWLWICLVFLFNRRQLKRYFYYVRTFVVQCWYLLRQGCQRLRHLLDGSQVHNQQQSIVSFENLVSQVWTDLDATEIHMQSTEAHDLQAQPSKQPMQAHDVAPMHNIQADTKKRSFSKKVSDSMQLPPLSLCKPVNNCMQQQQQHLQEQAKTLEEKLDCFGVKGSVTAIKVGPVITLFEYQPHIETKISKIIALEDDLALALQAISIRIIAPIPGRSVVGFEVANKQRASVFLSNALHTDNFQQFEGNLPMILGQDVVGATVVIDLALSPHLLIAGSTGSGKSCALNGMLISLLYKYTAAALKLVLIDPKRLEFSIYGQLPHLLFPIVTDPKRAILVLRYIVQMMEQRYCQMESLGVRNINDYQVLCKSDTTLEPMPFVVVMIDELADLMMTAGKEIEDLIIRITQMARAAGIHLIVATQRPSVDVITGLIKANFPSRIALRVASKIDSRTILDASGAQKLLGKGDMLYLDCGAQLRRVHGAYITKQEIEHVLDFIVNNQPPTEHVQLQSIQTDVLLEEDNHLYQDVLQFLQTRDDVSISLLQRKFRIGYNRAARIIEQLESEGYIIQDPSGRTKIVIHTEKKQ